MPSETEATTTATTIETARDAGSEPNAAETEPLGEAGKAALDAERTARRTAEKRVKDLETAEQARTDAQRKADEAAAAKAGEWETLASKRERERDEATTEATTLRTEVDQLRAAMAGGLKDGWKALPDRLRKIGERLHGEDDVLGRWGFLHDPETVALARELTEKTPAARGNGADPPAGANGTPTLAQTTDEFRRMHGVRR